MKPDMEMAALMGKAAADIAKAGEHQAVGILTITGAQICLYFGRGRENKGFKRKEMVSMLKGLSNHFSFLLAELEKGNVEIEELNAHTDCLGVKQSGVEPMFEDDDKDSPCPLCGGTGEISVGKKCICQL